MDSILTVLLLIFVLVAAMIGIGHLLWVGVAALLGYQVRTVSSSQFKPRGQIQQSQSVEATMNELAEAGLIDKPTLFRVVEALKIHRVRSWSPIELMANHATQKTTPPPLPAIPVEPFQSVLQIPDTTTSFEPTQAPEPTINFPAPALAPWIDSAVAQAIRPEPVVHKPMPVTQRRSFSTVLASFMEERNIRWGELLGGLLIVGCSIALVISFWADIASRPAFKFSLFTAVTAAIFGLGLYSEHRWKLPTTSRGVLLIATLLVPLNFVAFSAFSIHATGVVDFVAQAIALVLFTWLSFKGAKVIAPQWPGILTAGISALSAFLLFAHAIAPRHLQPGLLLLAGAIPVLIYTICNSAMIVGACRWKSLHAAAADATLLVLGVLSFAAVLALGSMIWATGHVQWALTWSSPLIAVAGISPLLVGLFVLRRAQANNLGRHRMTGALAAIIGLFSIIGAMAIAWPIAALTMPIAFYAFAIFTVLAFALKVPKGHLLALACLTFAWLIGFHHLSAHVPWTSYELNALAALFVPQAGDALAILVGLIAVGAIALDRVERAEDSKIYLGFCLPVAGLSLLLLNQHGFGLAGNPFAATWVYGGYAFLGFGFAWRNRSHAASWIGWLMALAAFVQGFMSPSSSHDPFLPAFLAWTALATLGQLILHYTDRSQPLVRSCKVASMIGVVAVAAIALFGALWPTWSHVAQSGPSIVTWLLLGVLITALSLDVIIHGNRMAQFALVLAGWAACPMFASRFADFATLALAMQWSLATYLLVGFAIWLVASRRPRVDPTSITINPAWQLFLWLGIAPIALLSMAAVGSALLNFAAPRTGLPWIGPDLSHALPLLGVCLVLIGFGLRAQKPAMIFGGSLAACFALTTYQLLAMLSGASVSADIVRLLQANAAVMAGFALAWLGCRRFMSRRELLDGNFFIGGQAITAIVLLILPLLWSFPFLMWTRHGASPAVSDAWAWAATILGLTAFLLWKSTSPNRLRVRTLVLAGMMIDLLAALTADMLWQQGFHALLVGAVAFMTALLVTASQFSTRFSEGIVLGEAFGPDHAEGPLAYQRPSPNAHERILARLAVRFGGQNLASVVKLWVLLIGALVIAAAILGSAFDPSAAFWMPALVMSVALIWTMLACWAWRPGVLYGANFAIVVAANLLYLLKFSSIYRGGSAFVAINVFALAFPAMAWLVLELQLFRRGPEKLASRLPVYRVATWVAIAIIAFFAIFAGPVLQLFVGTQSDLLTIYAALAAAGVATAASLWDPQSRRAIAGLYILGLAAVLIGLESLNVHSDWLIWHACIDLAAFSLAIAGGARICRNLGVVAKALGIPVEGRSFSIGWLPAAQTCVSAVVATLAFYAELNIADSSARWIAAVALMGEVISLGLLAHQLRSSVARIATLLLGAAAVIALAWAPFSPGLAMLAERCIGAFCALSALSAIYGWFLHTSHENSAWKKAVADIFQTIIGLDIVLMLGTLAIEISDLLAGGHVTMHPLAIWGFAFMILVGGVACLMVAIRGREMASAWRSGCVYAAEALVGITFIHLRITAPYLFGGIFAEWWPLVVMAIAFGGLGAGQLLARSGQTVIAEPIERTGILLPLLPVLGFWLMPSSVNLQTLLLVACLFYGVVAAVRRSFGFAVMAGLAGNGALWRVLSQSAGLGFFEHPQLWVIPVALSVLAASQIYQTRISADQLRAVRYLCLLAAYISSTADVFLNGVAVAPWLPLVLAGLSVAGVMVGVALRIRPFLYLGTIFLALSIFTMIYYASAQLHWTWIWYVAGILLGGGIITFFALFEKKRSQMLALVDGLKQWQ